MSKSSSYRSSKPNTMTGSVHEQEQRQEPFFSPEGGASFFQPKLSIGQPDDKFEKEADNVADKVISKKGMDEEPAVQRQEISSIQCKGDSPGVASDSLTSRIDSSRGKGSTLPGHTLDEMESSFGQDLSQVNIHTDAASVQMNRELGAQAFTHGNDIYFNTGKFDPASTTGKHLLAHELTHVVQQGAGSHPLQRKPDIQRAPSPDTIQKIRNQIQQLGLDLEDGDLNYLQQTYPGGIMVFPQQAIISIWGSTSNTVLKYPGFIVRPVSAPESKVDTFIFNVGKGRSLLVSSQAGGSVLLDAGSGQASTRGSQAAGRLAASVSNVFGAGIASVPQSIKISHMDTDHYNAVDDVLRIPAMSTATVEVSRQQLQQATQRVGRDWNRMNVQFNATQALVQLDVVGNNLSVTRSIIGEMEIIEYRSVAAHAALATSTFNKNNTSPVTIVRDLNTNTTMVYTADGQGRLLNEAVNTMGEAAFLRIMGGGGRNLAQVEVPHHGGAVDAGPDARGMVRFYRYAFESSNGNVNFFTQTSPNFAGKPSSSVSFLRSSGIPVDMVQDDPSTARGTSQVRKATGSTMQNLTINNGVVQQVGNLANQSAGDIHRAYAARAGLSSLLENAQALEQAFSTAGDPRLSGPLATTRASIEALKTELDTHLNTYWTAMETAAAGDGMRATTDTTAIQAAVRNVAAAAQRVTTASANNGQMINSIISDLSGRMRLLRNMYEISDAVNKGDMGRLETAKTEQTRLLRVARATLGKTVYNDIFKAVWTEVSEKWMDELEEFAGNTSRIEMMRRIQADRRMLLGESLARQMKLNEIAESASQGTLPGNSPAAPMGSRVGAGAMIVIQLASMTMEIMESVKHTNAVNERFKKAENAQGLRDLVWWQSRGVIPTIALVNYESGFHDKYVEKISGDEAYNALADEKAPKYDKIVIKDVKESDQKSVILHFYNEFTTMEEWVEQMGNPASSKSGWIVKREGLWAAKRWNSDDARYDYYALSTDLQVIMSKFFAHLEETESDKLTRESATETTATIKDSALLFGTDRYAYVYGNTGNLERIDMDDLLPDDKLPAIALQGTKFVYDYGDMQVVRAIDLPTYDVLSRYYWVSEGGQFADNSGTHTRMMVEPNIRGLAYVKPSHIKNEMPPANPKTKK